MHLGDSIFIFIMALVLFGPKKLPEMARQIGKLMAEFRRASNDFRLQIDEELRTMERQEQLTAQQKKQDAALEPSILPPSLAGEQQAGNSLPADTAEPARGLAVLPPSIGEQVSAGSPYAVSAPEPPPVEIEDHPLLHVDLIPHDPHGSPDQPTGLAAAEANAALLSHNDDAHTSTGTDIDLATEQPLHHG